MLRNDHPRFQLSWRQGTRADPYSDQSPLVWERVRFGVSCHWGTPGAGSRPPRAGVRCSLPTFARRGVRRCRRSSTSGSGARVCGVLGSAASHVGGSEAASEPCPVVLDIAGRRIEIAPGDATRIRDAAATRAGRSSAARDLSLLLDRALARGQVLALRRAEARTLAQLAGDVGLAMVAVQINAPSRPAASRPAQEHWSSSGATTTRA
jgi:hypothetical protein